MVQDADRDQCGGGSTFGLVGSGIHPSLDGRPIVGRDGFAVVTFRFDFTCFCPTRTHAVELRDVLDGKWSHPGKKKTA